ncbi:MAG: amidohydrolase, partial [Candidatus Eisenbacteria bacterium]
MDRYLLISADCHGGPTIAQARQYLDPELREDFDAWWADEEGRNHRHLEMTGMPLFGPEARAEFESEAAEGLRGAWDSERRLRELDEDGVVAEVIFPQGPLPFGAGLLTYQYQQDPAYWLAGCRAQNRWLADFCAEVPGRRAGVGLVTVDDIDTTVQEITWLREHGVFGGIMLSSGTGDNPCYNHPRYEPVWAACADLGMPIHTHSGWTPNYGNHPGSLGIWLHEITWWAHRPLWFLIWSGVFQRHPGLRLIFTEQRADWLLPTLADLDAQYERAMFRHLRQTLPLKPSEYFRRNGYVGASFMNDGEWQTRYQLGVDRLMWGSDYPHLEGWWPHTAERLATTFQEVPRKELESMLGRTAAQVYGFDLNRLLPLAAELGPS